MAEGKENRVPADDGESHKDAADGAKGTAEDGMRKERRHGRSRSVGGSGGDAVYGIGLIGALVYYISTATSFWLGVLGVLKAIVWPAIFVYEALKFFSN